MPREGAKIVFLGEQPLAEQRRVGAHPAAIGDAHGLQQRARPDALIGEEGDLGRDFAVALAGASRTLASLSGRVSSVLGSFWSVAVRDSLLEPVGHATKLDKTRTGAKTRSEFARSFPQPKGEAENFRSI
jgi:hypothetical protein